MVEYLLASCCPGLHGSYLLFAAWSCCGWHWWLGWHSIGFAVVVMLDHLAVLPDLHAGYRETSIDGWLIVACLAQLPSQVED